MVTEQIYAGEFLIHAANGTISRAEVTLIANSGDLAPGTVLGTITASGKYAPYDDTATDGTETATAILYAAAANSTADQTVVVIDYHAEVDGSLLTGNDAAGTADLDARHIRVR